MGSGSGSNGVLAAKKPPAYVRGMETANQTPTKVRNWITGMAPDTSAMATAVFSSVRISSTQPAHSFYCKGQALSKNGPKLIRQCAHFVSMYAMMHIARLLLAALTGGHSVQSLSTSTPLHNQSAGTTS